MSERAQLLLQIADDELILGWRDSEWTGIAPSLEEDVAYVSGLLDEPDLVRLPPRRDDPEQRRLHAENVAQVAT